MISRNPIRPKGFWVPRGFARDVSWLNLPVDYYKNGMSTHCYCGASVYSTIQKEEKPWKTSGKQGGFVR